MKHFLLAIVLIFAVGMMPGCHNLQGQVSITETYVSSYEIAGAVYPLAKTYLARLEETGTLVGDKLVAYKAGYGRAQAFGIQAGEILTKYIDAPSASLMTNYPALLQEVVIILADLSGGKLVNASGKPMAMKGVGKEYVRGMRVVPDVGKVALKPKGLAITPDQVILTLNLLLVTIDKLAAYYGAPETLSAEQKAAYKARVEFTKKSIPDWL